MEDLTARQYAQQVGLSYDAARKRLKRQQVPGAYQLASGEWRVPPAAAGQHSPTAPEPAEPAVEESRVDSQYQGHDLEQLRAEEIRLKCVRLCREERIKQGEVIDRGTTTSTAATAAMALTRKLAQYPDQKADRLCDRMGITDAEQRHAVWADLTADMVEIQLAVKAEFDQLMGGA